MGSKLEEMYGRTYHDIEILIGLINNNIPYTPRANCSKEETSGYSKQRTKLVKSLVAGIFRASRAVRPIYVKNIGFTIVVNNGLTLNIPPGYIDTIYLGTFPFATSVILHGAVMNRLDFMGNPEFK